MAILIGILTFISLTLLIILFFPKSILTREENEEEAEAGGFIYQIKPLLSAVAKYNARLPLRQHKMKLDKMMAAAGDPMKIKVSADEFIAFSQLCALAGGLLFSLVFGFSVIVLLLGAAAGYGLPYLWLNDARKNRQLSIRRELPDFLDLLTLTVEAGLEFNTAVGKLLKTSRKSPLIDEFKLMMQELKVGEPRRRALKSMAERVDIPDFSGFVSSLLQTDKLGASLGPTLRIQADQMRIRRMQLAEKAGAEASVKLLIPLMVFIFPAVFIMIFGPIIIPLFFK